MAANLREFIRRAAELIEKRRDEYATNDDFSVNLTLNCSKLTASIPVKFGTINSLIRYLFIYMKEITIVHNMMKLQYNTIQARDADVIALQLYSHMPIKRQKSYLT
jgi:S-methylmethionine-dependent homocysteine/selenocysteine methylase